MRVITLMLFLLILSVGFSAEPAVVTFPSLNNLVRIKDNIIISQGLVKVSAGVKVVGEATNLTITTYPLTSDFNLTLNGLPAEYKPFSNLTDGDELIIDYSLDLEAGTHLIVIDFISSEGSHRIESAIRVEKEWVPLIINQSAWIQGTARAGKKVGWISFIQAFNPNTYMIEGLVEASIPPNASDIEVVINGLTQALNYNSWTDTFSALETKDYSLTILTPPVTELSQEISVLNSSQNLALIRNNLTLKNNALIDYANVSLEFNVRPSNLISIYCDCDWRLLNDSVSINLPLVKAGSLNSLLIDYVDSPPLLKVAPKLFSSNSSVDLSVLLIPEREVNGLNLEVEVMAPDQGIVYADIISKELLLPGESFNTSISFNLTNLPQGNYSVVVKAREGTRLIASDKEWFLLSPSYSVLTVVFLILFLSLIALVFSLTIIQKTIKY
jgi:hypothetical protein